MEYGINNLIRITDAALDFFDDVKKANRDEKITWLEGIKIGLRNMPEVLDILTQKSYKNVPLELKDIDTEEERLLTLHICRRLGCNEQDAKLKMHEVFAFVGAGIRLAT